MTDFKDKKQVKYLNLGHEEFEKDLKKFSKVFFPKRSKDLRPGSSGDMMINQAAFIGDILSFYLEDRLRNSNLATATDVDQIYNLSRFLSYQPEGPRAARGTTNFYLEVPATTGSAGQKIPDMRYAVNFKNVKLQNSNGVIFEALEDVDFREVNSSSSLNVKVSKRNNSGSPTHYVLRHQGEVAAGETKVQQITIGDFKEFREVEISDPNVLEIKSVVDSDGEKWYEVDHLAKDFVFESVENIGEDLKDVPRILKLRAAPRRYKIKTNPRTGRTKLIFGNGRAEDVGSPIVPKPEDLALDLKGKLVFNSDFVDPENFLKNRKLGLTPYDTTLTIRHRAGGGTVSNTSENSLTDIIGKKADFASAGLDTGEVNNTLQSFATNNTEPIVGGDEPETPRELQEIAPGRFAAQGRLNTREDYISRVLSMPSKFGKVFRTYATVNCEPGGGVQLHIIAKDHLGKLSMPTENMKKNIKNYLLRFTRLGQGIDILDGKIINIGVEFTIVVKPGENKTEAKLVALQKIKNYFDINKWAINQPIVLDEIRCLIKEVDSVISISELKIINKANKLNGRTYSSEVFDVKGNTSSGIVFPITNAIFEVKFPDSDIKAAAL